MSDLERDTQSLLNKLAKWRTLLAGWQLGTRTDEDPECRAVRDHREATIMLRAEVSALTMLFITKGVFTKEEFWTALQTEAMLLDRDYEQRFPGVEATEYGLAMDLRRINEAGWMKNWKR